MARFYIFLVIVTIGLGVVSLVSVVDAQVRQSVNYKIQSDSVNFGGGLSTSTNYNLESTAGEVATGDLSGNAYNIRSGYQQMNNTYIAITAPSSVSMTPSIPGITGGFANGSTSVTVTTDSAAGYALSIRASVSPALKKGTDFISDYIPGGDPDPDYDFITNSGDSHLGYAPYGVDVVQRFRNNGTICNAGSLITVQKCWDGLKTSDVQISKKTSANTPNGTQTRIYFRVGIGGSSLQAAGVYTATTTLTAIPL